MENFNFELFENILVKKFLHEPKLILCFSFYKTTTTEKDRKIKFGNILSKKILQASKHKLGFEKRKSTTTKKGRKINFRDV